MGMQSGCKNLYECRCNLDAKICTNVDAIWMLKSVRMWVQSGYKNLYKVNATWIRKSVRTWMQSEFQTLYECGCNPYTKIRTNVIQSGYQNMYECDTIRLPKSVRMCMQWGCQNLNIRWCKSLILTDVQVFYWCYYMRFTYLFRANT